MLDRATLELTMLEIARQSGDRIDDHTRDTIRTGLRQALQAKERYRRILGTPEFRLEKPNRFRR